MLGRPPFGSCVGPLFVTVTGFFARHLASPGFDKKSVLYFLGFAWVASRSCTLLSSERSGSDSRVSALSQPKAGHIS
jgi:hypothetical protein